MKSSLKKLMAIFMSLTFLVACGNQSNETEQATEATEATEAATEQTEAVTEAEVETEEESEESEVSGGNRITWRIEADPGTLDPLNFGGQEGMQVVNNMLEGLTRIIDEKPELAAAESYEVSEDGKTYTFKIREDANWSDGEPVTAHDFVFAWLNYLDPELQKSYAQDFFIIEGAEAYFNGEGSKEDVKINTLDDKTLEVTLVNPSDSFLSTVSYVIFYPSREDIATDPEGKWSVDPEVAVSNGPFILKEYNLNEGLVLAKNEEYWNADNLGLDGIDVVFIEDGASALTAFQNGEIDVMKGVPADQIPELAATSEEFHSLPMRGTQYYVINTQHEPLDDVNVRRALSMAIDRTQLVTEVAPLGQDAARGLVGNLIHLSDGTEFVEAREDYPNIPVTADVEGAQAALAEAGYPDGEGFPVLNLVVDQRAEHPQVAQALQQMWKENLNIDVEIQLVERDAIGDIRKAGEFDLARWGWSADYDDPYNFLQLAQSDSDRNHGKYSNSEYDELINKAITTSGEERDQAYLEAEKIGFGEDVAFLVMYHTSDPSMVRENLVGWDKTGFAHWYFGNASLEN